jgi:hypothetical protein
VTLQNRVTPLSELVAEPGRGLVYGNRGCLHDANGRIVRGWATRRWIGCRLEFKGWHRSPLLRPGKFTELFFLDEATAFAAGHRPCALCRREDYNALGVRADPFDERLHRERLDGRVRRLHPARFDALPDGAYVLLGGAPYVVAREHVLRWSAAGYVDARPRPGGEATAITPPSLLALLRDGWEGAVPLLHPSAQVIGPSSQASLPASPPAAATASRPK